MFGDRLLILAPHTDDAELGCGGTIARLTSEGVAVHVVAFSAPDEFPTLRDEFARASEGLGATAEVLGFETTYFTRDRQDILQALIGYRDEHNPTAVLLPSASDVHQDHATLHAEGIRAFKNTTVLGYELPRNHLTFAPQVFVTLTDAHVAAKLAALRCYESQKARPYFDDEYIAGLARVRGGQIDTRYA